MTDAPFQPTEPPPSPAPLSQPPSARPPWTLILIAVAVVAVLGVGYLVLSAAPGGPAQAAYTVQAYTPPSELITGGDHVVAHAAPDAVSPSVVMFGAGVTLNVTGRVSRPLGGDWYAISWNNQTAFVRQQDAVAGQGAPPVAAEHPVQTEEEIKKPEDVETPDAQEDDVFSPPAPPPEGDFDLSNVDWIRAPSARDFARFYPHRALDQGRSGRVVLDCIAAPNGMLDCSVAQENPPGAGFGEAALSISRQVRIQPTLPDGRSVAGGHLRLPLTFRSD